MKCPICNSKNHKSLLNLDCGKFDNSIIYKTAKVVSCAKCGHVFNILKPTEIKNLLLYYDEESAPTNMSSPDKVGDKTGNTGPLTRARYDHLFNFLASYINPQSRILDAGCATGGFLDYLGEQGYHDLYGFDSSIKYTSFANKKWKKRIKVGNLESKIPFTPESMGLIIADQIFEHLINIRKAFQESSRVLGDDGYLCISIPDASRYKDNYFFDFFWFTLREHVEHFDIVHLTLLANQEGFELVKYSQYSTPMMTNEMILPVLTVMLKKSNRKNFAINTKNKNYFKLKDQIGKYIQRDTEKLKAKQQTFSKLASSGRPVYAWGMGREFLYIYESAGLKNCNLTGLIDQNPYKQENFSISKIKISDKAILKKADRDSIIVISAIAHQVPIKDELKKLQYKGTILKI